jgi:restriction system protein
MSSRPAMSSQRLSSPGRSPAAAAAASARVACTWASGAERAVLVTLARLPPAARKAATATTPTVDLIDGDKLCDLVRDQQIGLRIVAEVDEGWFDRFDA